jgi:peptidyl-prolyl cis-trans isomerase C
LIRERRREAMKRSFFEVLLILAFCGTFFVGARVGFSQEKAVLARVGERVITQSDFDEYMKKYAQIGKGEPSTPEQKKVLLDNIVRGMLITMEAEKEKLDQKPEVRSRLEMFRSDALIQEYVTTKIMPLVKVTDKEVDDRFKENPNLLPRESLKLQEIQVKTEKEAEAIYEQLKKGGDFTQIATEKSISASKRAGGNMRPISRGQLPKVLEEVAFNLKPGEFSKPTKTDQGYYILALVERKERSPADMKKFEGMIKEKIRKIEETRKAQELIEKKAEELKKNLKVEMHYDRIK